MFDLPDSRGNPFNYSDPITDPDKFIGRDEEIKKVKYSLAQAVADDPSYQNMGIIGKKGTGKTSLSKMCEKIAERNNILPVRITLNKSDTNENNQIFLKIIRQIIEQVEGGIKDSFLKQLRGQSQGLQFHFKVLDWEPNIDSPEENSIKAAQFDSALTDDLEKIYRTIEEEAILLTVDNSEYIADMRNVIERINNVFTGIDGYMLFVIGLENTFNKMSEVYPSAIRSFDKIYLDRYEDISITEKAVKKPLDDDLIEDLDQSTVTEIHRLTGGDPYEINLIMSHVFKKYEQGDLECLQITRGVLDDVLNSLKRTNRVESRIETSYIQKFTNLHFSTLEAVLKLQGGSVDEITRYVKIKHSIRSNLDSDSEFEKISNILEDLSINNVMYMRNDEYIPIQDKYVLSYIKYSQLNQYDQKYFGIFLDDRRHQIATNIYSEISREMQSLGIDLHTHITPNIPSIDQHRMQSMVDIGQSSTDNSGENKKYNSIGDIGVVDALSDDFYKKADLNKTSDDMQYGPVTTFNFRVELDWINSSLFITTHIDESEDLPQKRRKIKDWVRDLNKELNDDIIKYQLKTSRDCFRESQLWLIRGNIERSLEKIEESLELFESYAQAWLIKSDIHFVKGDIYKSIDCLEQAIEYNPAYTRAYLDMAKLYSKLGDEENAEKQLEEAVKLTPDEPDTFAKAGCICRELDLPQLEEEFAKKALKIDENHSHALYHQLRSSASKDNYSKAFAYKDEILDSTDINNDYATMAMASTANILLKYGEGELALRTIYPALSSSREEISDYVRRVEHSALELMGYKSCTMTASWPENTDDLISTLIY